MPLKKLEARGAARLPAVQELRYFFSQLCQGAVVDYEGVRCGDAGAHVLLVGVVWLVRAPLPLLGGHKLVPRYRIRLTGPGLDSRKAHVAGASMASRKPPAARSASTSAVVRTDSMTAGHLDALASIIRRRMI